MKFFYIKKQDYHSFGSKIALFEMLDSGRNTATFYGKFLENFGDQSVYCIDYKELNTKNAYKLAFLLGEDLKTLVKEYKKWKLKKF